jgi:hypothetical protein
MPGVKGKQQRRKELASNIWFQTLTPRQQDLLLLRLCEARPRVPEHVRAVELRARAKLV